MATLAWSLIVVLGYAVVRRWAVGLYFFTFFPSGDDYCECIAANVDNIAEVTAGVVE